jgi:hypothetical protein
MIPTLSHQVKWRHTPRVATILPESFPLRGTQPFATVSFGRIGFSHCDLAGTMDHRNAFIESERAVSQFLDRVLT